MATMHMGSNKFDYEPNSITPFNKSLLDHSGFKYRNQKNKAVDAQYARKKLIEKTIKELHDNLFDIKRTKSYSKMAERSDEMIQRLHELEEQLKNEERYFLLLRNTKKRGGTHRKRKRRKTRKRSM